VTTVRDEAAERGVSRLRSARDPAVAALVQLDGAEHVIRIRRHNARSVEADAHRTTRVPDLDDVAPISGLSPTRTMRASF